MPLQITAAASSRITKQRLSKKKPLFKNAPRRKSGLQGPGKPSAKNEPSYHGHADLIRSLPGFTERRAVLELMRDGQDGMFMDIPERGAGMNSTRVAEVLNFRAALPPLVTMAHLHALGRSPTEVDKEVAELIRCRRLRKISLPGQASECVVRVEEWVQRVKRGGDLTDDVKEKYITLLTGTSSQTISSTAFTTLEAKALTLAGFLTATSSRSASMSAVLLPGASTMSTLTSLATVSASGSVQAVGGRAILDHAAGGDRNSASSITSAVAERSALLYSFALPSTGPYFKLLHTARSHLLSLLVKLSPHHRVASQQSLRERWDGGVIGLDYVAENKKARGEFAGVLPGRTKKWKSFYGLRYEWILAECVGSGLVEGVKTGDGGVGVRVV